MERKLIKVDDVYKLVEVTKYGNLIIGITDLDYQLTWSDRIQKLSLKNCQEVECGYDLDEFISEADTSHLARWTSDSHELMFDEGFKIGFQKALELMGDKKYSLSDLKRGFNLGIESSAKDTWGKWGLFTEFIQSLQQTEWDVEIEMDICGDKVYEVPEPKLDEDGCLLLKLKTK